MKRTIGRLGFSTVLIFCLILPAARGDETSEEKIRALFEGAIAAMGGDAYMGVRNIVSEGQFFMFNNRGESSGLIKFTDYTRLPDKSRFELGNKKSELEITIFDLEKNEGWIMEGELEAREATEDDMKSFWAAANHSLDNILRFRWNDPQNKLFYLGAGEGADVTREVVRLIDPGNDEVVVYFDRISKLPVKVESQRVNERGVRVRMADEYSQWHKIQDILTPMRIDSYSNGRRSSQQFFLKLSYNNNLRDDLFSRPASKTKKK
ncbi:MAG: hypothetical protein LBJ21_00940 [Acidobacteriota bacterium]|nr:hypothetical protein [Acidobacteriota bacterium]